MNLPVITGSQPTKVHEFYKTLLFNVQSLETLGKLQDVKGNVRSVIDKLKGIKSDLVRGQSGWQDWDFPQLVKALKMWKDINPIESSDDIKKKLPGAYSRHFETHNYPARPGGCVYCQSETHKSIACDQLTKVDDHRKHLAKNGLCFNCTRGQHRAAGCKSRSACHLEDSPTGDQDEVYKEFQEQLQRSSERWYETTLPWKGNHPPLPNNKSGSLRRFNSLVRKLERSDLLERYDKVIKDQLEQGIVERASEVPQGREFYIPHKPVVKESAESTKLRIVYDASARASENSPSLNECLNPGPPLQNQLWNVLVRARFHPVLITGDLKQAFLQVRIHEKDRDALRFHWFKDLQTKTIEVLRFTRALFGLAPSPFLLGGVIQQHLENFRTVHPEIVSEIEKVYVDDLISGGENEIEAEQLKSKAIEIFSDATFDLHKWHSNVRDLESPIKVRAEDTETFAKQQLGVPNGEQASILGLSWNKEKDTIGIKFPSGVAEPTKRGILGKVARIYDPLGLVAPITLTGKMLYREVCNAKLAWDTKLPYELSRKLMKWEESLPTSAMTKRPLPLLRENITDIHLHSFGDASGKGVAAAVYAVVFQPSAVNQGLVAAKARLAKQGLTIPRLELVSGHMAVNLISNVKAALEGFNVSQQHCWLDSSVALHWIAGNGNYKQFVANRVAKIKQHGDVKWRYINTKENPADLASRGGQLSRTIYGGEDQFGCQIVQSGQPTSQRALRQRVKLKRKS